MLAMIVHHLDDDHSVRIVSLLDDQPHPAGEPQRVLPSPIASERMEPESPESVEVLEPARPLNRSDSLDVAVTDLGSPLAYGEAEALEAAFEAARAEADLHRRSLSDAALTLLTA